MRKQKELIDRIQGIIIIAIAILIFLQCLKFLLESLR